MPYCNLNILACCSSSNIFGSCIGSRGLESVGKLWLRSQLHVVMPKVRSCYARWQINSFLLLCKVEDFCYKLNLGDNNSFFLCCVKWCVLSNSVTIMYSCYNTK